MVRVTPLQLTESRGKVENITEFSDLGPSGCFAGFVEDEEFGFLHPFTGPATVMAHVYFVHFSFETQRLKGFRLIADYRQGFPIGGHRQRQVPAVCLFGSLNVSALHVAKTQPDTPPLRSNSAPTRTLQELPLTSIVNRNCSICRVSQLWASKNISAVG